MTTDAPSPRPATQPDPPTGPVLYFDGVCGLCNGFVDFVMARDARGAFRFATLQGQAGEVAMRDFEAQTGNRIQGEGELRSFLLRHGHSLHWKSDAVLLSLQKLGGIWMVAGWLRLLPLAIRNLVYDFIAERRYGWFGKKEACRLPTPAERDRFLD